MNPIKGNKNALWALAAAGGLWAWQNRDKIQSWVNNQRSQMSSQGQVGRQYSGEPTTGATRRMGADEYGTTGPRMYDEPLDRRF